MNPLDFIEKLAGLLARWRSRWGYITILALFETTSAEVAHLLTLSSEGLVVVEGIVFFAWSCLWLYGTRRVVMPSATPTIAFCFDVELEGERNYRRVIRRIRKQLSHLQLDRDIRVLQTGPGVVENESEAGQYCRRFDVHQVVWGTASYGSVSSEEMLEFDVSYHLSLNDVIAQSIDLFQRDFQILAQGRQFTIKILNDLVDVKIVADDFLELSLGIIAIQALTSGLTNDAIKILRLVVSRLVAKNERGATKERTLQVRRLRELLHGAMIHQAYRSHEQGDHRSTVALLQQLLPMYPANIDIRLTIARAYYYLGEIRLAVQQTADILRLDNSNPSAFTNQAFFSIRRRNYEDAGKWYARLRASRRALTVELQTVTQFLEERYEETPEEHAYLYGLAIVNGLDDPTAMFADLCEFMVKTENMPSYGPLRRRANELLRTAQS